MNKKVHLTLWVFALLLPLITISVLTIVEVSNEVTQFVVRFPARPVDPYDPFLGRYLNLEINLDVSNDSNTFSEGDYFFNVEIESPKIWQLHIVANDQKPSTPFLKGKVLSNTFYLPTVKYYLQEEQALWADSHLRQFTKDPQYKIEIEGYVVDGNLSPRDLFINDLPLSEWIKMQ